MPGVTYYLPLFPCVTDLAALPSFTIEKGSVLNLPVEDAQGCDNTLYTLEQACFTEKLLMPLLGRR